jgi:outer membrane lipoprotein-sorting protein
MKSLFAVFALLACIVPPSHAQSQGPITPPPKYEIKKVHPVPAPDPPPMPSEQIVKQFVQHEDEYKKAYNTYSFQQTFRIEEEPGQGTGGEFTVSGVIYTKPDGQRFDRIIKQPLSTLKVSAFSLDDVRTFNSLPLFVLTSDVLSNYDVTYQGKEKLDELNTYIFRVKPRQVDRTHPRFDGAVWVDDRDFAIVKSYGQFVTDLAGEGTKLPFKFFEIYRENIGKFWFPTYVSSDESIAAKNGALHLRLVARSTDFKQGPPVDFSATPDALPAASPSHP